MKKVSEIDINAIDTQSPEFQNALKLISFTSQSVFLTGKAGTGKSTFLRYLTQTTKKRHVVLAPTGIAAVNAGGQTLHSFFKLPFKPLLPDDPEWASDFRLKERIKFSREKIKLLKSLDLIIIDEISMVRVDIIDFIDRLLRAYCGNKRLPFAGKQLLLVGDVFQLEPVITSDTQEVLKRYYADGFFFFNARVFQELPIVPIELKKVYRQADHAFISMLDRIRVGSPLTEDIRLLNSRVIHSDELFSDDFVMTIATRREMVDYINQTKLDQLPSRAVEYAGEINGDFPDSSLPTDRSLVLKADAQVVFVKNDFEKRWVNGSIGKVVETNEEDILVELEDGTRHTVKFEVWDNVKYSYDSEKKQVVEDVIGTFRQLPVKLAWALTIHKSQGLTFDRVIVDIGRGTFSGGQSYVALSRCRSLQGLKLKSTINARDIFVNNKVVQFSHNFNDLTLINDALELAKADDLYQRAAKAHAKGDFYDAMDLFCEAASLKCVTDKEEVRRLLRQKISLLYTQRQELDHLKKRIKEYESKFAKLSTEYVELGEECRSEGWNMEAAIANYNKAIDLTPEYAPAWIGKGLALADMGEYDDSISALNHAASLDAKDYRALYEAGRIIIANGDIALGMDYLLRALQRNSKIAAVHLALADGYEKVGDDEKALEHRARAKKLKK